MGNNYAQRSLSPCRLCVFAPWLSERCIRCTDFSLFSPVEDSGRLPSVGIEEISHLSLRGKLAVLLYLSQNPRNDDDD